MYINVNVFNATEEYTLKWLNDKFYFIYILLQFFFKERKEK